jgi:hypothetical protein
MTLATILTICVLFSAASGDLISSRLGAASAWARPAAYQSAAPAPPKPDAVSGSASGSQTAPATPATTAPQAPTPAQVSGDQPKTKAAKHKRRFKKNTSAVEATAASGAPGPGASTPNQVSSGTPGTANCPPEKKIVHNGGTTEPPIQLLGGPGGAQASHQRDTTDQLLGSVENNLKQVSGRQLSTAQQEMVNQIQQFIQQSKTAVAAGDMERGHNLAMKAHLLSEELVKPQ